MNSLINQSDYKGMSIFHKLLLCFIGITILVAATSGITFYLYATKIMKDSIKGELKNYLKNSIYYFDKTYTSYLQGDLISLESSENINNVLTADDNKINFRIPPVEKLFLNLSAINKNYLSIRFVNRKGKEMAVVSGNKRIKTYNSLENLPPSDLPSPDVLQTEMTELFNRLKKSPPRTLLFEGPFKHSGKSTFLIGISKLEPDIGDFGGAVIAHIDLTEYITYLSNIKVFNKSLIWVIDNKFNKLLVPEKYNEISSKNDETVIMFETYRLGTERDELLTVIFAIPPQIFISEMHETVLIALAIAVSLIIISSIFAYFVSRHFSKPLIDLAQTSLAISKGNLNVRVDTNASGEIGQLAFAFNKMTEDLQNTIYKREQAEEEIRRGYDLLKNTQSQLVQNEKMASLGLLIAGIAHEINTPIGAIYNVTSDLDYKFQTLIKNIRILSELDEKETNDFITFLEDMILLKDNHSANRLTRQEKKSIEELLKDNGIKNQSGITAALSLLNFTDKEKMVKYIGLFKKEEIFNVIEPLGHIMSSTQICKISAGKISNIIKALKYYAYTDMAREESINVNESISNTLVLLHNKLKYSIDVTTHLDNNLPNIFATSDINQIWTNLLNNSYDAIKENHDVSKGKIIIDTYISEKNNQKFVCVKISDNGTGIPYNIKEKIFDPFFTTKDIGQGTGLGLSIVMGIVKKHKGGILLETSEGNTTFEVLLPIKKKENISTFQDDLEISCNNITRCV